MLKLPGAARPIQTAAVTDEDPTAALARLEAQIATLSEAKAKLVRMVELEAELRRLKAETAGALGAPGDLPRLTIARQRRSIVRSKVEANVSSQSRYVRQAAARTRSESEAKRLLLEAGWTDSRVAKLLKVGRSTVNAYYSGRRSIPDEHAEKLSGPPWNVPRSAWPRIA